MEDKIQDGQTQEVQLGKQYCVGWRNQACEWLKYHMMATLQHIYLKTFFEESSKKSVPYYTQPDPNLMMLTGGWRYNYARALNVHMRNSTKLTLQGHYVMLIMHLYVALLCHLIWYY